MLKTIDGELVLEKICYMLPDGSLQLVGPLSKSAVMRGLGAMSDDEYIKHIHATAIPKDATNVRYVATEELPPLGLIGAWKHTEKGPLELDLIKAKHILLQHANSVIIEKCWKLQECSFVGEDGSALQKQIDSLRKSCESLRAADGSDVVLRCFKEMKEIVHCNERQTSYALDQVEI